MSIKVKLFKESTGIGSAWVASCVDFCLSESGNDPGGAVRALRKSLHCVYLLEERGQRNILKRRDVSLALRDDEVFDRQTEPLEQNEMPMIGSERAAALELALLKVA